MAVKFFKVGGSIRDKLMGIAKQSKDIDYAVEAESYESMKQAIQGRGGKIFLEKPEFWVIRAHLPGSMPADYALCRKDGQYTDGRRPDSVSAATLLEDLARRDFTINAIAESEDGVLIDPYCGEADIQAKLIRCVGSARARFEEDALRMLRAIRFKVKLGFALHDEISYALAGNYPDLLAKLVSVSTERKKDELTKCFAHDTLKTLNVLDRFSIFTRHLFKDNQLWLKPTMELR